MYLGSKVFAGSKITYNCNETIPGANFLGTLGVTGWVDLNLLFSKGLIYLNPVSSASIPFSSTPFLGYSQEFRETY